MNEIPAFFLIASIFASSAVCNINPSDLGLQPPRPPENVEFGECFVVHEIYRGATLADRYNYNHICPVKYPNDEPEPPEEEKVWYIVGTLKGAESPTSLPYDYTPIERFLIRFIFLRDTMVEFKIRESIITFEFSIIFQSLQQSHVFYGMIYDNVNLSQAASNKIGVLHEMNIRENIKMGNNVEALYEIIDEKIYITFNSEQGEPLLIFSKTEANIERITRSQSAKLQLMLRIHTTYYILTFSSNAEARQFSVSLSKYIKKLNLDKVFPNIRARFEENQITIDS